MKAKMMTTTIAAAMMAAMATATKTATMVTMKAKMMTTTITAAMMAAMATATKTATMATRMEGRRREEGRKGGGDGTGGELDVHTDLWATHLRWKAQSRPVHIPSAMHVKGRRGGGRGW